MSMMKARWIDQDPYSLEADPLTGALRVKVDPAGALERTANGVNVKALGIINDMLAGSITDDKLATQYIKADGTRAFTGDQSMGGYRLTSLGAPVDATDAATKNYVDSKIAGLAWRPPVDDSINYIITTAGVAPTGTAAEGEKCLNTADNLLYTFTGGAWDTGTAVATGARYLWNYDGTDTSGSSGSYSHDNNIYEFDGTAWTTYVPEANWAVFRKSDEMGFVFDADNSEWVQFTGTGQITAGDGMYKVGNVLNVGAGDGIIVNPDNVQVSAAAIAGAGLVDDGSNNLTLDPTIAGDGLSIDPTLKILSVNVGDGLTIASDIISVVVADLAGTGLEDDGSNNLRISSAAAGNGLVGGSGAPLSVVGGNGIAVLADNIELGPLTGNWTATDGVNYYQIKGLADPTDPQDAATKNYVDTQVANINNRQVEQFVLTATDITNGYITLSQTPADPARVVLIVQGAPGMANGSDFGVSGAQVQWVGYGLDGKLVAGDTLTVVYDI